MKSTVKKVINQELEKLVEKTGQKEEYEKQLQIVGELAKKYPHGYHKIKKSFLNKLKKSEGLK